MKTKKLIAGLLLVLTALMFNGCFSGLNKVEGNYDVETETRDFPAFDEVVNEGEFDVYIIQDGLSEVEIEAESNLIPLIRTRIQGSALVIDTRDNLGNNYPMKLYVHTDNIEGIKLSGSGLMHAEGISTGDLEADISGSGDIFISGNANDVHATISGSGSLDMGLVCDEVEADISGSGEMEIWGTANQGDFNISGSGSVRAYDLSLKGCYAKISGSGNIYVTVEEYLNVNISGSGNVYYLGSPTIDVNISGSGSVINP